MRNLNIEVWVKTHNIQPFGVRDEQGSESYGLRYEGVEFMLPCVTEIVPSRVSLADCAMTDLIAYHAENIYAVKPDGAAYKEFIEVFGEDATDDLMSIVRSQAQFDDLIAE
jgi:hypothetical protein